MAVVTLNFVFIGAGMAQLETLPVYAKNEAGVTERGSGLFFLNTLVIVLSQLPMARLLEGHRRMRTLAVLGVVWAVGLLIVPICGDRRKRLGRLGFPRADLRDHRRGNVSTEPSRRRSSPTSPTTA